MTYFGFLSLFLLPPILILLVLAYLDQKRGKKLPAELRAAPAWLVILILIVVAVIYTTPWDNYLVATRVWWYDPRLVAGITIGWVPVEEYLFFALQTALTGLLTITLARYLQNQGPEFSQDSSLRSWSASIASILWLCAGLALFYSVSPATYTSLLLVWALPPLALQLAFGADILWHYRKLTALAVFLPTAYLALADSLAIGLGTWTINPVQSFQLFIGELPIEELLFFLCTNTLVVFGIVLAVSVSGNARLKSSISHIREKINQTPSVDQDLTS